MALYKFEMAHQSILNKELYNMEIGIIGTGNMGRSYAKYLVQLGHQVKIANSSGPTSLTALA